MTRWVPIAAIILIWAATVWAGYSAGGKAALINQIEVDNEQAGDIRDRVGSVSVRDDDVQFRD